jgi:hypothetical protein
MSVPTAFNFEKYSKLRARTLRNQNNDNVITNTTGFKRKANRMILIVAFRLIIHLDVSGSYNPCRIVIV